MKKDTALFSPFGVNKSKELVKVFGKQDQIFKAVEIFSELSTQLSGYFMLQETDFEEEVRESNIVILMARARIAFSTLQTIYDEDTLKTQEQLLVNTERVLNSLDNEKNIQEGSDGRESDIRNYR